MMMDIFSRNLNCCLHVAAKRFGLKWSQQSGHSLCAKAVRRVCSRLRNTADDLVIVLPLKKARIAQNERASAYASNPISSQRHPTKPFHEFIIEHGVVRARFALIDDFVGHYNHQRYHERLKNLTPAYVYFGRGQTILLEREKIKRRTFEKRRLQHARSAA